MSTRIKLTRDTVGTEITRSGVCEEKYSISFIFCYARSESILKLLKKIFIRTVFGLSIEKWCGWPQIKYKLRSFSFVRSPNKMSESDNEEKREWVFALLTFHFDFREKN